MLSALISKLEKETGQNADYLRDVAAESTSAFAKFLLMMPMANHRREASKEAWHAARLVATRHEDCGPCVQIVVDMALADGVDESLLLDVWHRRLDKVPAEVSVAMRLATAVVEGAEEATALSAEAAALLGRGAVVDLALGISTARVFPSMKRALGYAHSCSVVRLRAGEHAMTESMAEA